MKTLAVKNTWKNAKNRTININAFKCALNTDHQFDAAFRNSVNKVIMYSTVSRLNFFQGMVKLRAMTRLQSHLQK